MEVLLVVPLTATLPEIVADPEPMSSFAIFEPPPAVIVRLPAFREPDPTLSVVV